MSGEGEEAQALSLARALLSRLLALEEGPMRARAAARALAAGDPELTALALAALCKSGGTFERVALSAVGQPSSTRSSASPTRRWRSSMPPRWPEDSPR